MKMTDEQITQVSLILYRAVTDQKVKLAFGSRKRTENREALEKGTPLENYRMDWLRESRGKCVSFLQQLAAEFNRDHPHDCASVQDLMDVLSSTIYQFQNATRRHDKKKKG